MAVGEDERQAELRILLQKIEDQLNAAMSYATITPMRREVKEALRLLKKAQKLGPQ